MDQLVVLHNFKTDLLERMLQKEISTSFALGILKEIYIELDDETSILYLHWAQDDLANSDTQWYWPKADRCNIEDKIMERARIVPGYF